MYYDIPSILDNERKCLTLLKKMLEKCTTEKPDKFFMRCTKSDISYHQFYKDSDGKRRSRKLGDEFDPKVIDIKQQAWNKALLDVVNSNIKLLDSFPKDYHAYDPDSIDELLPPIYRDHTGMVNKYLIRDHLCQWANQDYPRNRIAVTTPHRNSDGDILRSKSEVIHYELLKAHNVNFMTDVELSLRTEDNSRVKKTVDFLIKTATGSHIIIEHFGMLHENDYYQTRFADKIKLLHINGYTLGDNLFCFADKVDGTINAHAIADFIRNVIIPKVTM